jgi:hypothetical protein
VPAEQPQEEKCQKNKLLMTTAKYRRQLLDDLKEWLMATKLADQKMKLRYMGPLVVISQNKGGAYILSELDGTVWQNKVGAFRVIPYMARKKIQLPEKITDMLDVLQKTLKELQDEEELNSLEEFHFGDDA